jgi:putative endonuclease
MFFVYVPQNENTGRHYTGFTADLNQRLGQHNSGITKSTKNRGTWTLVYREQHAIRVAPCGARNTLNQGEGREELKQIPGQIVQEAG